jgi:hypothetical protein
MSKCFFTQRGGGTRKTPKRCQGTLGVKEKTLETSRKAKKTLN